MAAECRRRHDPDSFAAPHSEDGIRDYLAKGD
jgi:hypothetical protein